MLLKMGLKNEPTESDTSVADVIDFVRRQMHKDTNEIEDDDSAEEEEDLNEVDEGKMPNLMTLKLITLTVSMMKKTLPRRR